MRKLAKFLKPYAALLVLAVALLFGQAMCDLNLPNFMSSIVNVGIQQGGIVETSPKAISAKGLDFVTIFMNDTDKAAVQGAYSLVKAGGADHNAKYPLSKTEDIYVQNEGAGTAEVAGAYARGVTTFTTLMQSSAGGAPAGDGAQMSGGDFSKLYEMAPLLKNIPQAALASAQEVAAATDSSILGQTSTAITKLLYSELGVDMGALQTGYILKVGALMLLLTLLSAASTIGVGFLSARIAAGVSRTLRHEQFAKVESFSSAEFDRFSTASLITRNTNDVQQVMILLIMGIRMVCYAPIMGVGGVIMAVGKSISMTWIIALGVVVLIGLMLVVFSVAMPKFKIVQKLLDRLNLVSRENLSGIMVIRAFGTQDFEEARFEKANRQQMDTSLFVNRVMVFMMPAIMFLMNIITVLIVWAGGHQIEQGTMQVGDMMAFMQYAMQIIMSFMMIAMMFIMIPRAAVAAERIAEVLESKPSVLDPEQPKHFNSEIKGRIEFVNVHFRYGNAEDDVLEDISFTANPGETTAFIGSTGSGKSTLINLIPRFYDVTQGSIRIDGIDVRDVTQHELRAAVGYIPQRGMLFSGDIASNLRYGAPNATDEELARAAEVAQATEFINSSDEGYQREVAQGGGNVSGGQKQRLAIARALATKAPIYIFDDSFSALDFKTDAALRSALTGYTNGATVLIVAQRVSTIMNAQQIIVLDNGKIVGKGTHKELLKACPTYHEIAISQLSEEELQ